MTFEDSSGAFGAVQQETKEGGASPSPRFFRVFKNGWAGRVFVVSNLEQHRVFGNTLPVDHIDAPDWAFNYEDVEWLPGYEGTLDERRDEALVETILEIAEGASLTGPVSIKVDAQQQQQQQPDMVVMPPHYTRYEIEPIRFVVENYGPSFLVGNIIKYITRYDAKNGVEDLLKAERYTRMLRAFISKDPDWWKADKEPVRG